MTLPTKTIRRPNAPKIFVNADVPYLKFSSQKAADRFIQMIVTVQGLAKEMGDWAHNHGIELVITETWSSGAEDIKLGRESDTHRTGRAFDVRTRNLPDWFKTKFLEHFRFLYNDKHGAITKDGPNLIVDKAHGSGPHWHIQVKRGSK